MTKPNPYIEVVKKWLADPKSVSQKELEDNREAAYDAAYAATYAAAAAAAVGAAYAAAHDAASYWVKRYEELTK